MRAPAGCTHGETQQGGGGMKKHEDVHAHVHHPPLPPTHPLHSNTNIHTHNLPPLYTQVLERVWPLLAPRAPLLFLDTVIGLDALLALRLPIAMRKVSRVCVCVVLLSWSKQQG
jgi:hypothetical protein